MRFGMGCGCFSIVLAVIAMILFIVLPSVVTDNETLNGLMGNIFCGEPDAYVNSSQSYSYRPGETTFTLGAGCQKPDNVIEDVSLTQSLVGGGLFTLGLLAGIGLIIFSAGRATTQKVKDLSISLSGAQPINIDYDGRIPRGNPANPPSPTGESLVETLRALEQSYEEGLINKEEYDDARKRILDKL
jgi:hypothetical protein